MDKGLNVFLFLFRDMSFDPYINLGSGMTFGRWCAKNGRGTVWLAILVQELLSRGTWLGWARNRCCLWSYLKHTRNGGWGGRSTRLGSSQSLVFLSEPSSNSCNMVWFWSTGMNCLRCSTMLVHRSFTACCLTEKSSGLEFAGVKCFKILTKSTSSFWFHISLKRVEATMDSIRERNTSTALKRPLAMSRRAQFCRPPYMASTRRTSLTDCPAIWAFLLHCVLSTTRGNERPYCDWVS